MNDKMVRNSIEAEYMNIVNLNAWCTIYQKMCRECEAYPYTCTEARMPRNKLYNRYRDVNPYDHSRIILKQCDRDYINANLVNVERAGRKYILTQGPLLSTVAHFWLMVWEQNSQAILMLNKVIEKNDIKCYWYWPRGTGADYRLEIPKVKLAVEQIREEDCGYYSTRVFRLINTLTSKSREIIQFHYTTWPDFGVPSSPNAFLDFLTKVRASGALEPNAGPAVVHCSAGIGRSGTFCLVDTCLVLIEKEGVESVNIQQVLMEMRRDRMGLIQTPDQLKFSYQAIIEGAKRLDPNYNPESTSEEIYSTVAEEPEEEAPPSPPPRGESLSPRGESLSVPPARPLPAIPTTSSLSNLQSVMRWNSSESDSDSDMQQTTSAHDTPDSSADDEDDEPMVIGSMDPETPRRRYIRELNKGAPPIKKRSQSTSRGRIIKRIKSLLKGKQFSSRKTEDVLATFEEAVKPKEEWKNILKIGITGLNTASITAYRNQTNCKKQEVTCKKKVKVLGRHYATATLQMTEKLYSPFKFVVIR